MECFTTRCCSAAAKSAFAWPSARWRLTSPGWVSADILLIVIVSALAGLGLGLGLASAQYADLAILVLPSLAIIATALLAALRQ
jgi:hypothetical protein